MIELIIVYSIGVLFAYMKHCGFMWSLCYKYNIKLSNEQKKEEYKDMLRFLWHSWFWFINLSNDYFLFKDKYFLKLKL